MLNCIGDAAAGFDVFAGDEGEAARKPNREEKTRMVRGALLQTCSFSFGFG